MRQGLAPTPVPGGHLHALDERASRLNPHTSFHQINRGFPQPGITRLGLKSSANLALAPLGFLSNTFVVKNLVRGHRRMPLEVHTVDTMILRFDWVHGPAASTCSLVLPVNLPTTIR